MQVPNFSRRLCFGAFEVDLHAGELRKRGIKIKLQEQPFQILVMLVSRPGEVVTREELCKKLWPADTFVDFEVGLNSAVKKLRDALGDSAESPRFVETLHRRGYRFVAPVDAGTSSSQPATRSDSPPTLLEAAQPAAVSIATAAESDTVVTPSRRKGTPYRLAERVILYSAILTFLVGVVGLRQKLEKTNATSIHANVVPSPYNVRLKSPEQARLATAERVDPDLYQTFLNGQYALNKGTKQSLKNSIAYFSTALQNDPNYAPAYAGLAMAYISMQVSGRPVRENLDRARGAAVKAVSLDERNAEAHLALARIRSIYDWDWHGAEQEFQRAFALNPAHFGAHIWYGQHLMHMGRMEEALEMFKRAQTIDPLSPRSYINLATWFAAVKRFDEGIEQARKALKLDPEFSGAHWWIVDMELEQRKYEEAFAELRSFDPGEKDRTAWAHAYALSGHTHEAERILDKLESDNEIIASNESYKVARSYAALGRRDNAFTWLEKALVARADGTRFLKNDWALQPLRSDPRFQAFVRRVGQPQ